MVEQMASKDILIHQAKHKLHGTLFQSNCSLRDWGSSVGTNKLGEKPTQIEVLFSAFFVEHNLPIATSDHAGSFFRDMFPDSKIAARYKFKRTKNTHILAGGVAKNNIEEFSKQIQSTWFGLASHGSSDESDN